MPTVVTTSAAEESADTEDRRSLGDCSQAAIAAARAAAMTASNRAWWLGRCGPQAVSGGVAYGVVSGSFTSHGTLYVAVPDAFLKVAVMVPVPTVSGVPVMVLLPLRDIPLGTPVTVTVGGGYP